MTNAPTALPQLTPLADVAKQLRIPYRRLYDRALARQFSHVRIGKERYVTTEQMTALIDTYTVGQSTPQSDRERAIQETRDRLQRQSTRRQTARRRDAA